jgi:hypothetical protein
MDPGIPLRPEHIGPAMKGITEGMVAGGDEGFDGHSDKTLRRL